MWPRNDGSSTPSTNSVGLERGLANCPAARASLTTGSAAPYVSTVAICSMILRLSRMCGAERSRNDSAQSPTWSRKPCARGDAGQRPAQLPRLTREHERRQRAQLREDRVDRGGIRPVGLLVRRKGAPGVRAPRARPSRQHPLDGLERLDAGLLRDATSCSSTSSHSSPSVATHLSSVVSFMFGQTALFEAGMNFLSGYSTPSRYSSPVSVATTNVLASLVAG